MKPESPTKQQFQTTKALLKRMETWARKQELEKKNKQIEWLKNQTLVISHNLEHHPEKFKVVKTNAEWIRVYYAKQLFAKLIDKAFANVCKESS